VDGWVDPREEAKKREERNFAKGLCSMPDGKKKESISSLRQDTKRFHREERSKREREKKDLNPEGKSCCVTKGRGEEVDAPGI